jgi:hypothetical protein
VKRSAWLAAVGAALCAALAVALLVFLGPRATAAGTPQPAQGQASHVVIVGIPGLSWNLVNKAGTPELWHLAEEGSVGALVDYAQQPLACPADGWLTLNSAARAQGPRPCTPLPAVVPASPGAQIPAMPRIVQDNQQFHEAPDWGLLGTLANCATAVGPGAALALASPAGAVPSYLPSAGDLSAAVLARCPLTVVDLGQVTVNGQNHTNSSERLVASTIDHQLAQIAAKLPPGTLLLVMAPGAAAAPGQGETPAGPPHLTPVVVSGRGFANGLLYSAATRRPGIVTLTDLTPTVAAWLGHQVPAGTVGARITRTDRGSLDAAVTSLMARDTAEQVWIATHGWFFIGYAVADVLAFAVPALLFSGSAAARRRRRARCWRVAGIVATAVPLGSYLANVAPWWTWAHPTWWLYGLTIAWTLVAGAAALAGPWRRSALGPFGALCAATLLLLAVDVISGSRLQLDAPFGLSLLVSGRYYGIGNDALGIYCVSTLTAAAWLAGSADSRMSLLSRPPQGVFWPWVPQGQVGLWPCGPQGRKRSSPEGHKGESSGLEAPRAETDLARGAPRPVPENPSVGLGNTKPNRESQRVRLGAPRPAPEAESGATGASRGKPVLVVGIVGGFAVIASGWPGFGAKVGGTIALVPCLLLLAAWFAGVRVGRRWALPVAVSGLAVFLVFAVISYFLPGAGVSDMGAFAGNLVHGRGGDLLQRKVMSNVGSLTLNVFGWLIPVAALGAGAALWRPAALRLRTLATAFTALPLLRVLAWLSWLVLVIGWFFDDSGVIVPTVALPFVVPLTIALAASVSTAAAGAGYLGTAFAGSSVAGRPPR